MSELHGSEVQRSGDAEVRRSGVAPVARKAAELRRLELLVTRRLDGLLRGEFLGRTPGPGSEVAGARAYEAGDDSRWIDWNLTARSITPQVRTTEADRELQTWTVVDRSASMNFGTTEREKGEVAFAAAAAFGFLTARHGNRFGLLVAGGDSVRRLGPTSTRPELLATLSRLYDIPRRNERADGDADLTGTLDALERARPRRGQVIVDLRLPRADERVDRLVAQPRPARADPTDAVRAGRRPARARAAGGGHAHARRHRVGPQHARAVELGAACASATPLLLAPATTTSPARSATPGASTSCSSPTPTG